MDSLEHSIAMGSPHGDSSRIAIQEVELHQFDLRYAHTRIMTGESIRSLASSLAQFGQISPLVVVSNGALVLIDGYRRVAALKLNGKDTATTELWPCTEHQAIMRMLARSGERKWQAFEEACLLRELLNSSGLSRARLAKLLGKDPSWAARRLDLLDVVDEEWIELIRSGRLSSWALSRVLAPLARANEAHAKTLAGWIAKEGASTRDLANWFDHYRKSNNPTRERMVIDPSLFLKASRAKSREREAEVLRQGPEGKWLCDLSAILRSLRRLQKDFGPLHGADLSALRQILHQIKAVLSSVDERIERMHHDQCADPRSNPGPAPQANPDPGHQPDP